MRGPPINALMMMSLLRAQDLAGIQVKQRENDVRERDESEIRPLITTKRISMPYSQRTPFIVENKPDGLIMACLGEDHVLLSTNLISKTLLTASLNGEKAPKIIGVRVVD